MNMRAGALLIGLLLSCFQGALVAKDLSLEVRLDEIEMIKATEKSGDELYFNVTEYSTVERPRHYQVPNFPTHWLSDYLKEVKDVSLWNNTLPEDGAVILVISLVERDVPPWNVDDLIGSVKLKLKNNKGKLEKEWVIPKNSYTVLEKGTQNKFDLTGDNGNYQIQLHIQESKKQPAKNNASQ